MNFNALEMMKTESNVENEAKVKINPISSVGMNTNIRDMLYYINKNEVLFTVGKHAVIQNIHSQKMEFLEPSLENTNDTNACTISGEITAMAITTQRKYFALARAALPIDTESSFARPQSHIFIYGLKIQQRKDIDEVPLKRTIPIKALAYPVDSLVSLAFSSDGKFLVAQTSMSNWTFVVWDWIRTRKIATAEAHTKVFNTICVYM